MRSVLSGARAAAILVQQSVWRVPAMPGIRQHDRFRFDRVVPDKGKSLAEGVIEPWTKPRYKHLTIEMRRYARAKGIPFDVPFRDLFDQPACRDHRGRP